jgi:hypothetical protein
MFKLAIPSTIFVTLSLAFIAEAADCPLVNVAGNYTAITLHTENATVWSENFSSGCMNTGYIPNPVIQPDGLIVSKRGSALM